MPPFPGEETLTTLYTDIHYYFTAPSLHPVLHRFDKASYFYIYYNSTRHTSRIEIANNPGTAEQDAFHGFLDTCTIINSRRFPTLVTLVVDGAAKHGGGGGVVGSQDEWRLVSADPRDPGKNKYRLHTLDIYFWQADDAKLVVDLLRKLLEPGQLDVVAGEDQKQGGRHEEDEVVSPVVQNLENLAVEDSGYGQQRMGGKMRGGGGGGGGGGGSQGAATGLGTGQAMNLPPPPPLQPSVGSSPSRNAAASISPVSDMADHRGRQSSTAKREDFTPMAYNPAAPAAPEPIAHREDTPPPIDDGKGTGLGAAALHDNQYGQHMPQSPPYTGMPGQYGSPPPPQQHQGSIGGVSPFAPPPTQPTNTDHRHGSIAAQTYMPTSPDPHTQMFNSQQQHPVQTPGTQFYASMNDGNLSHKPLQHVQPQYADYLNSGPSPPPGGYSGYQYGSTSSGVPQQQQAGNSYDVHSQVYRPTESEAAHHHHSHQQQQQPGRTGSSTSKPPSKFDQRADRVEKGVGRLFKKIEKRIG